MNLIGEALKQLSANLSFETDQCILVYDDLDTPIGSIELV
jgi:peptidyl-tRNA hydrolase